MSWYDEPSRTESLFTERGESVLEVEEMSREVSLLGDGIVLPLIYFPKVNKK